MLKSFTRYLNESVFRGPDTEGGSDAGALETDVDAGGGDTGGGDNDSGGTGGSEGSESQKPLSVREQLKASIEEVRAEEEGKGKTPKKDSKTGRFERQAKPEGEVAPVVDPAAAAAPAAAAIPAPESLPKEAKAEWDKTPPAIQAAFVKREQDMAAGVDQLQQRYRLIDQAIAPHNDALRQMNATPADAVNRMFLWFKALAGSPSQSFPELAKSMGIDWGKLAAATTSGAAPAAGAVDPAAANGAPEIPEPIKNYVGTLEKQVKDLTQVVQQVYGGFNGIQQNMNAQNQARTEENLSIWAKDKAHFQDVRNDMAKMIESGIVPLKPDGQVDLDTAYERAIYFNPTVRAKVLAEQEQADNAAKLKAQEAATTAQQTDANRARRAAVSIAPTTPGTTGAALAGKKKPGQKTSVRDSLKAAVAELRDQ